MEIEKWLEIIEDYREYLSENDLNTFFRKLGKYFEDDKNAEIVIAEYLEDITIWKQYWGLNTKSIDPPNLFYNLLLNSSEEKAKEFQKEYIKKIRPRRKRPHTREEELLIYLRKKYTI